MKNTLKEIIEKSEKHTNVSFKNKEKRIAFDEDFGKSKMELANKVIGKNSAILLKKLSEKNNKNMGENFPENQQNTQKIT